MKREVSYNMHGIQCEFKLPAQISIHIHVYYILYIHVLHIWIRVEKHMQLPLYLNMMNEYSDFRRLTCFESATFGFFRIISSNLSRCMYMQKKYKWIHSIPTVSWPYMVPVDSIFIYSIHTYPFHRIIHW